MAQLRPKIVKLARIIGSVTGIMTKIDENAPEYYSLVNIVSDDEADIAIAAGLRKEGVDIISCPTCGRTRIDLIGLVNRVDKKGRQDRGGDPAAAG